MDKIRMYLPVVWESQTEADRPAGVLFTLDVTLAKRIQHLAEVAKHEQLLFVCQQARFVTVSETPGFLETSLDDDDECVIVGEDAMSAFDALERGDASGAPYAIGIRGETLRVLDDGWYLRMYDKYSDVEFETAELPIPALPLDATSFSPAPAPLAADRVGSRNLPAPSHTTVRAVPHTAVHE